MADASLITSNLFEPEYKVNVWLIRSHDIVHRKNRDFGMDAIKKSGFAKAAIKIIECIPEVSGSILGGFDNSNLSEEIFAQNFLNTNCKHHVNYHDEKLCTVEMTARFTTDLKSLQKLDDRLLSSLHLEIITPVGRVQV